MISEDLLGPQDPIAIVGLGARLPGGANSPEQFWNLLLEGYDAITDIPKDRWDGKYFHDPENLGLVGKSIQDKGGFLKGYNIDEVDLKFFYLSPREAKTLDPNQRLLLEVTYETFENAGVALEQMSGSRTGVFVGISATDYSHLQFPDINTIDVHTQTGVSTSIVANRISYFYNLIGPSFIVDTACSSTLVALNCACQSMRTHECDSALCGAVNLMMFPEISIGFSKLGVLSPDGHCKAFDAKANGYVRSEGCGMVLLKRLSDAERDGNRIFAVIRGTHVGSDGHYQQQMTSPSEQQQAVVIREVLRKSSISTADITYVESHGTGTFVGDPIECRSVSSVLNIGRDTGNPILIGSAKSNVGHLEPAAGIVSLIKMAMVMKHGVIPPTINVKKANPNIDLKKLNMKIVTTTTKFPAPLRPEVPRSALVSAFGFGGTNGGCVIQEYRGGKGLKDVKSGVKEIERDELFLLSARSVESLKEQAKRLADYLEMPSSAPIQHVAYTLGCHRTQHKQCRLAFVADSKEKAIAELRAFVNDEKDTGIVQTRFASLTPTEKLRKLCLVYCGQGSQWYGMGRELYRENVVFREWMDRIDNCLKELGAEYSIVEEIITGTEETSHVDQVEYLQPIFFAIQVCVYKVMEAAGVKPDIIVGHSLGEIAAAHVSGALSIEDATRVAWERSKGQKFCNGMGHMAAVTGEKDDLLSLIEGKKVDIAGHNAPTRWNISGETEDMNEVERVATENEESSIRVRRLLVDEPMHSQYVDLVHDQIISGLKGITPLRPSTPLVSTYTPLEKEVKMDGEYWWASLRNPVQFMGAILEMIRRTSTDSSGDEDSVKNEEDEDKKEDGSSHSAKEIEWVFLECGPHNVLRTFLGEIMGSEGKPFIYVPTLLRKAENERMLMLRSLANVYCLGYNLDLKKSVFVPYNTYDERKARVLFEESSLSAKEDVSEYCFVEGLPLYAWTRTQCWNESPMQHEHRLGPADGHPIARIRQDTLNPCWQSDISTSHIPWVLDHCLQGNIVVPGVTFVEPFWLRDVQFLNAFYMNKGETVRVNISFDPIHKPGSRSATVNAYNVTLSSRVLPKGEFTLHCAVVMEAEEEVIKREKQQLTTIPLLQPDFVPSQPSQAFDTIDLDAYRKMCPIEIPIDQFFAQLWTDGLELKRQLRLTRRIWINDRDNPLMSLAYIEVNPETTEEELGKWGFMYPPFLDSCLQSGLSAREKRGAFFPVEAVRASFIRSVPKTARHCWSLSRKDPITGRLSMTCCDDEGKVYGSLQDVLIRYLESGKRGSKLGMIGGAETPMFEHKWEQIATLPSSSSETQSKSAAFPIISFDELDKDFGNTTGLPSLDNAQFLEECNAMMNGIGSEFQTKEMADVVVPMNNTLTVAIILEVFRSKLNLWKEEAELIRSKKIDVSAIKAIPVKQLAESVNILPFYHRLFLLLSRYLSEAGYLTLSLTPEAQQKANTEPTFFIENYVIAPLAPFFHDETQTLPHNEDCNALAAEILTKYPQMRPSTTLMMDVGRRMKDVIVDGENAVTLIFKDKGLADAVYRDDGEVRTLNYVTQGVLQRLVAAVQAQKKNKEAAGLSEEETVLKETKSDCPLKILEVGAGTGGTTAYLMEFLDPLTTTYTYTDISASFFGTAKQRFSRYASFMNFQTLNIENSPVEQGFEPHSQDIIIAANVVHATSDLSATLSHIQQLLKPGGYLILLEALSGLKWLDIVFGLTDGWWALKDTKFRQHPLLTPDMWRDILKETGFSSSHVFNEWTAGIQGDSQQKKIFARLGVTVAQASQLPKEQIDKQIALFSEKKQEWIEHATEAGKSKATTTCVVFVEDRNLVSGRLISSLLRDGHIVIGATHSPLPNAKESDSASLLHQLCASSQNVLPNDPQKPYGSLLDEKEISAFLQNFYAIYIPDASTKRDGYDSIFNLVTEKKLPAIVALVHLWSLDLPCVAKTEDEVKHGFEMNIYSPLYMAHALMDASKTPAVSSHITTWGVTEGVWCVTGRSQGMVKGEVGLGQSTIWGLNRSIINELDSVHPRSLDIARCPGSTEVSGVVGILSSTALDAKEKAEKEGSSPSIKAPTSAVVELCETEIAVRGNKCFGQRLIQFHDSSELALVEKSLPSIPLAPSSNSSASASASASSASSSSCTGASESYYTLTTPRKNLLCLEERFRMAELPAGEVEVEVAASGVVYRDVMMWTWQLPENARQGSNLGIEFAGIVRRIGDGVTRVKVGDRVFGVGRECCGLYTVVHEKNVGLCPNDGKYSWDQLGAIGLEMSTVYYSLVTVAKVKKGDYVLIHAGSGGIGLCAISLCRHFGAIPIVTTRSEWKRNYLSKMGVPYVLSSESPAFAQECKKITNGKGVNIVLNSLPSQELIHAGLSSLCKGGVFVEIGKVDLYQGTMVSLLPFISNITYRVVAIDQFIYDNDDILSEVFDGCSKLLCSNSFVPPPVTTFALSQAEDAYSFMKDGRHVGKVVIAPISSNLPLCGECTSSSNEYTSLCVPHFRRVIGAESQGNYIDATKTYLVTGGTAGFSLSLATGLLKRGAKYLAVSSRSGKGDSTRQQHFEALRKKYGADIRVFKCDASSPEETRAMLAEIRKTMPPITGVIHGAMLLHDGYMMNLDDKAFWEVLGPKSFGAWLIHEDTVRNNDPITMFVLLSSLNVVVGTHGQANYGSANMFLDSLSLYRRSQGLPCISVQWGVLGGVGYVHRNTTTLGANMGQFGFRAFSSDWANRILHTCLEAQADIEDEHIGRKRFLEENAGHHSLSASLAQLQAETFKKLPMGLRPFSLRPENEAQHPSHFFDGAESLTNIRAARRVFNHPLSVPVTVGVFNVSWEPLFAFMASLAETGRFKYIKEQVDREIELRSETSKSNESGSATESTSSSSTSKSGQYASVAEALRTIVSPEESVAFLAQAIAKESARVLGISSEEEISIDVPLSQYGLDSLTAVEMKNWTEKQVKVDIPVVDFVRGPSSDQLARSMLAKFYEKFQRPKQSTPSETGEATTSGTSTASSASTASTKQSERATEKAQSLPEKEFEEHKEKKKQPLTAYVFTGQSGLKAGVGMDIYELYPEAKEIWDKCDAHFMEELGISILKIVRENPIEYKIDFTDGEKGRILREKYMNFRITNDDAVMKEVHSVDPTINSRAFPNVAPDTPHFIFHSPTGLLSMTHFAQPIIIIYEYVALACLRSHQNSKQIKEDLSNRHLFCGHSLGEYCALTAMGGIASAEEMAMVCFMRGMVMQSCVPRDPVTHMTDYAMAAVSPMRVAPWFKIEHLKNVIECTVNSCGGRLLQIVNYNVYNDQYVVSGEKYAIWQLSIVLTHVEEQTRKKNEDSSFKYDEELLAKSILSEIDRFCYEAISAYPYASTPIKLPRTTSVMPLEGIDMPFHSSVLRKVVPLFRSFLDSRLPSVDAFAYADRLIGKFITNTYSKETFSLSLSYVRQLIAVTNSPYLREAVGQLVDPSVNEMVLIHGMKNSQSSSSSNAYPPWLSMSNNEKARLLLRESLSYQFASPVQWIDTQNTFMLNGIRRVIEIGPSKTLSTMFSKSIMRLKEQGEQGHKIQQFIIRMNNRSSPNATEKGKATLGAVNSGIEILTFATDREVLEQLVKEEVQN
ncbi:putative polyketide synthase PksE [Monocercomonoides exilis]|uniref:putative polyketide synthase PksE n=1 Tax=Monocercomonoides exilis TaxID=2049356 RepID=UPI00355AB097|nr:putative polyketide synthase PksE [Monocercomonoides exilis]|eukprot:MONOS_12510.1-p1 / transcript=MONOS_12510.1 / gene=MONOS_12510 / organism=Monocercomonoides_exilis_PA203 / gene_product=polyketide synthase PksE / transcript_product=polyketide synthase PksE / location=Mono_scaffold00696:14722-25585(+) / protein_length=3602 / sequence_SO=supercontig / SO=protein_coding / is_pseudo=false